MTETSRDRYVKSGSVLQLITTGSRSKAKTVKNKTWVDIVKSAFPNIDCSKLAHAYRSYTLASATIDWLETLGVSEISRSTEVGIFEYLQLERNETSNPNPLNNYLQKFGFTNTLGISGGYCRFLFNRVEIQYKAAAFSRPYEMVVRLPQINSLPLRLVTLKQQQVERIQILNKYLGGTEGSLELFELLIDRL